MLGLTPCTTSYPSPSRSMAPGAKFSTMTSARFTMFLTRSSPRSDLRLTVMDFLLALNNRKYQESRFWLWLGADCRPNKERPASPPCGFSTLTTSAPSQASASVQDGPASNWVRSRIRTPARKAGNPRAMSQGPQISFMRPAGLWQLDRQDGGAALDQGLILPTTRPAFTLPVRALRG